MQYSWVEEAAKPKEGRMVRAPTVSTASVRPDIQQIKAFGWKPTPVIATVEPAAPVPDRNVPTFALSAMDYALSRNCRRGNSRDTK